MAVTVNCLAVLTAQRVRTTAATGLGQSGNQPQSLSGPGDGEVVIMSELAITLPLVTNWPSARPIG